MDDLFSSLIGSKALGILNCHRSRLSVIACNPIDSAKPFLQVNVGGIAKGVRQIRYCAFRMTHAGQNSEFNFTIAKWTSNKKHMITRCKPVMNSPIEVFMSNL